MRSIPARQRLAAFIDRRDDLDADATGEVVTVARATRTKSPA